MHTIDNKTQGTEVKHFWPLMEEYNLSAADEESLSGAGFENQIDIIKKIPKNKYIILRKDGTEKGYNLIIDKLKEAGLDIGKGKIMNMDGECQ